MHQKVGSPLFACRPKTQAKTLFSAFILADHRPLTSGMLSSEGLCVWTCTLPRRHGSTTIGRSSNRLLKLLSLSSSNSVSRSDPDPAVVTATAKSWECGFSSGTPTRQLDVSPRTSNVQCTAL